MAATLFRNQPGTAERADYAASLSGRTKAVILAGVLLSLFLAALDQTIVATALPAIIDPIVAQLPAELRSRFDLSEFKQGAGTEGSTSARPNVGERIDQSITQQFVQQRLDQQYSGIEGALKSGEAHRLAELQNDPQVLTSLKQRLEELPPGALDDPQAVNELLQQTRVSLEQEKP